MIALNCYSQTQFLKPTDTAKFCYTSTEMNYWIACSYRSNAYTAVIDSLKKNEVRNELKIKAKDYEIAKANELIEQKNELIKAQENYSVEVKKELSDEKRKVLFHKYIIAGLATLNIVQLLKN